MEVEDGQVPYLNKHNIINNGVDKKSVSAMHTTNSYIIMDLKHGTSQRSKAIR